MLHLSISAINCPNSGIRKMFALSNLMQDVVKFTVGEPDFDTPIDIKNAACMAISSGYTKYSPNSGIEELRLLISQDLKSSRDVQYDPQSQIIITCGGMEALYLAFLSILNVGDEVILGSPYFPNYISQILLCGGTPILIPLNEKNNFILTAEEIEEKITQKTKLLIINSPSNPLGSVIPNDEIRKIADMAQKYDFYIVSDEVYKYYNYTDKNITSITSMPGMQSRTVLIDSFSKTFAMTGWRIGYAASNASIISLMVKLQEHIAACVNTPTQYAAVVALQRKQEFLSLMFEKFRRRRDLLLKGIQSISNLSCICPQGAFYLFVNIKKTGLDSETFSYRLLNEEKVAVIPGNAFGPDGEGYVRLSYVTSEENIREGIKRIASFCNALDN